MRPRKTDWAAGALALVLAWAARAGPVFEEPPREYAVSGAVSTSDGKSAAGLLYTTLGKPLEIYDRKTRKFVKFTLKEITRIDTAIEIEKEEPYWYWKESGSDEKVYTGKTYPWRKYVATVTFPGGRKITGDLSGLFYLEAGGKKALYVLYKRQKGKEGQKPKDLTYVKSLVVSPDKDGVQDEKDSAAQEQ